MLIYSLVYLHLTWNQFHSTLYPTEDRQETCPMYVKLTSFAFVSVKQFRFRRLMPPDRISGFGEANWRDCLFMPQDLVEIQVEQPQKEDDYQESQQVLVHKAWESWWLQVWGWHICLSWTCIQCYSKWSSGLATFYGTGFGTCRIISESWLFQCALSMHLCMMALWLFNKDKVCWHILLTPITCLPLQRRCLECSSFIIFP